MILDKDFLETEYLNDYVCNNYWKLDKEELKELFTNLHYAISKRVDSETLREIEKETKLDTIDRLEV